MKAWVHSNKILVVLLLIVSTLGCAIEQYENEPKSKIRLLIEADTEAELSEKLASFSEEEKYKVRIARVHPEEPKFSITLTRPDSTILGANPFKLNEYRIGIYARKSMLRDQDFYETILYKLKSRIETDSASMP